METIEKVLDKISIARKKKGLSHENMAFELGISQAAIPIWNVTKANSP